jgi:hypothetical protein
MRPEDALQKSIVKAARQLGFLVVMINNAAKRDYKQTAYLKSMGMLPGASDLAIIGRNGWVYWLEVKTPKGKMSETQYDFREEVERCGHVYHVVRSIDEAVAYLQEWKGA